MKVGFTGTRDGMTLMQKNCVRNLLDTVVLKTSFHHGDCIGADAEAFEVAGKFGYHTVAHPGPGYLRANTPSDEVREPKPFLTRNRDIVDETDMLIAAPKSATTEGGGTWATIRYARQAGRQIWIIHQDGHGVYENPQAEGVSPRAALP